MKRKIEQALRDWKNNPTRMPLILIGARQVGKTYSVLAFGEREFKRVIELNFEKNPIFEAFFEGSLDPKEIIVNIELYFGISISAEHDLLFFDESQLCEKAITSLKYFTEMAPQYSVIAAGSLLGVSINRSSGSFPVGKVQLLRMFPLDFEEFLWAMDENYLAMAIRDGFTNCTAISDSLHERGLQKYREYLITGGMPASVTTHLNPATTVTETDIRRFILDAYSADTAKFADATQSVRIRASYESIPQQLAKESKKFRYKLAMKGGRAALLGDSIDWLVQSGIVMKCDLVTAGKVPLKAHIDPTSFKLYMSDVGLLSTRVNLTTKTLLQSGTWPGALTENYVAQALTANGHELLYWESGNQAEVDFVIEQESEIVPIEVKASHHVQSKSLTEFSKKYESKLAYRISTRNFGKSGVIESIPLYAAHCIG